VRLSERGAVRSDAPARRHALILGQRLTHWISRAPTLELDIALANYSLDLVGQARLWLDYAGRIEGGAATRTRWPWVRQAHEFRNVQMVELPNGDFAQTMLRQFLFASFLPGCSTRAPAARAMPRLPASPARR
jgi:phenylacetate-CoA oxygenase PaaI subunit